MIKLESLYGSSAKRILNDLAKLRIEVFHEFPYLYEGSLDYEKKYLERYFSTEKSLVLALWDKGQLVGASTAIHLPEEDPSIRDAVAKFYDPAQFVYFGESIISQAYRGMGYGKLFFEHRENFAKSLSARWVGFCAVIRDPNDIRRPSTYFSPESLWLKLGYEKIPGLTTEISWIEKGEDVESPKKLQFWTKSIL